jgi:hypothetical protein
VVEVAGASDPMSLDMSDPMNSGMLRPEKLGSAGASTTGPAQGSAQGAVQAGASKKSFTLPAISHPSHPKSSSRLQTQGASTTGSTLVR